MPFFFSCHYLSCFVASLDLVVASVTTSNSLHQTPSQLTLGGHHSSRNVCLNRSSETEINPSAKDGTWGIWLGPGRAAYEPEIWHTSPASWPIPQKWPHCLATAPPTGVTTTPGFTEPSRPSSGPHSTHHCSGPTPSDGPRRDISITSTIPTTTRSTAAMGTPSGISPVSGRLSLRF